MSLPSVTLLCYQNLIQTVICKFKLLSLTHLILSQCPYNDHSIKTNMTEVPASSTCMFVFSQVAINRWNSLIKEGIDLLSIYSCSFEYLVAGN